MANSKKSFCSHLQLVTTKSHMDKTGKETKDGQKEKVEEKHPLSSETKSFDILPKKDEIVENAEGKNMGDCNLQTKSVKSEVVLDGSKRAQNVSGESQLFFSKESLFHAGIGQSTDINTRELTTKKPLVKFTLSVESNPEDGEVKTSGANTSVTSDSLAMFLGAKVLEICKENSSLPSLKLNLSRQEVMSSPECGNSPEIHYTKGRMRLNSGDGSLTSTPTSRRRRQTFCGASYLSRRNLSRDNAFEDSEDNHSVSSSDYSPGSTVSSSGADRFHWTDKMSDESSSDGRFRKSIDFTDDPEIHAPLTPINKQLRIVTSVDRALNPHRRISVSSPKLDRVLNIGRSSSENLEHIAFVDLLKRLKLGQYLKHFPPNMTLLDFKLATEDELTEVYGVHDTEARKTLMAAIEVAKEEEESDTDSWVST